MVAGSVTIRPMTVSRDRWENDREGVLLVAKAQRRNRIVTLDGGHEILWEDDCE